MDPNIHNQSKNFKGYTNYPRISIPETNRKNISNTTNHNIIDCPKFDYLIKNLYGANSSLMDVYGSDNMLFSTGIGYPDELLIDMVDKQLGHNDSNGIIGDQEQNDIFLNNTVLSRVIPFFKQHYKKCHEEDKNDSSDTIILVDFLNLVRNPISNRQDGKFETESEFIENIHKLAEMLKKKGDFKKIYLVVKSFNFGKIPYTDILRIIMWSFCYSIPEWLNRTELVLVNGINDKDKEADDRALFILYDELSKINSPIIILSHDNFSNLESHLQRKVILNFFVMNEIAKTWETSHLIPKYTGTFKKSKNININEYIINSPN